MKLNPKFWQDEDEFLMRYEEVMAMPVRRLVHYQGTMSKEQWWSLLAIIDWLKWRDPREPKLNKKEKRFNKMTKEMDTLF